MSHLRQLAFAMMTLAALPALAFDYRSLAEPAPMYDAPSQKAVPLFIITRHTPVEVVVALEGWCKVRDAAGGLAWVEKRLLSEQRTLLVIAPRAQVRSEPSDKAALVFEAEKSVLLELVEPLPVNGWAKVRHRDGQAGYVRVNQVWGV